MMLPVSHVEFRTADYPHGLAIDVDGKNVHYYFPEDEVIDGAGWAEAAFECGYTVRNDIDDTRQKGLGYRPFVGNKAGVGPAWVD